MRQRDCIRSITTYPRRQRILKIQRDKMYNWVYDLLDQRHDVKADIWRLEQEIKSRKEELTWLKGRKKELEASGLSLIPTVTFSVSGNILRVLQLSQVHPKRRKR